MWRSSVRATAGCGARTTRSAPTRRCASREYAIDLDLLDADAARRRLAATSVVGGTYAPHCAAIHPAKLARGLADAVEARGASIYEQTRASAIEPGVVHTERGTLRADV